MKLDDMILVSVDDHVVEPPHLFEGRTPAKYADDAPRVVRTPEGWRFSARSYQSMGRGEYALDLMPAPVRQRPVT